MQRTIAEHAHCLHYRRAIADGGDDAENATHAVMNGTLGTAADAFDITLEAVLAGAEGRRLRHPLCRRVPWPQVSGL